MEPARNPMPIGIEDFKELIAKNYYFVDKTCLIKELQQTSGKVTLFTRPRRFGKTLALSMLYYFFTMDHAAENRKLFCGLAIEQAGETYMKEQGTRPVIFLTLKELQYKTYDLLLEGFRELLRSLYGDFRLLAESPKLAEDEQQFFCRILSKRANHSEMRTALKNLMQFLEQFYNKKPVLLLDEYDAPILFARQHGYYQECIDFLRGFLGAALKSNRHLDFAILTGVARISKESIFSGLNNLDVCSVLSNSYAECFGFTQDDVEKLMQDSGVSDKLPELKQWYDGYRFGQTEIYNPWSVINFVKNGCQFRPYWLNTSGNSILKELLEKVDKRRKTDLQGLLCGKSIKTPITENMVYDDIPKNRDALFMMLMTTGYLKPVKIWKDEENTEWVSLKIPNAEVRTAYRREILNHIAPTQGELLLHDMLASMADGDAVGFSENLSDILRDFVSFYDTAQPESFYHGLLLGFAVLMEGRYRVESNRESGYGRFDIAFFPKNASSPGIILEIKSVKSDDELRDSAQKALQQIRKNAYISEFSRQDVKDIWQYGISFHGKKVYLERSE